MTDLRLDGLVKRYGRVTALDGVSFDVEAGEFFCLLGPSAAGKTTTLRAIAGLEKLDAGRVCFAGRDVTDAPVQGRGMAMIFQTFALYPHLSVRENLAYPLREAGIERPRSTAGSARRPSSCASATRWTESPPRPRAASSSGSPSAGR